MALGPVALTPISLNRPVPVARAAALWAFAPCARGHGFTFGDEGKAGQRAQSSARFAVFRCLRSLPFFRWELPPRLTPWPARLTSLLGPLSPFREAFPSASSVGSQQPPFPSSRRQSPVTRGSKPPAPRGSAGLGYSKNPLLGR